MAHNREKKQKELLEAFKDAMGNISVACAKVGISRATFYNWKQEDEKFSEEATIALEDQKKRMDDFAEGKLYQHIKDGNVACLIFYLKTRHVSYKLKLALEGRIEMSRKLNDEEKALLKKALEHGGLPKDKG